MPPENCAIGLSAASFRPNCSSSRFAVARAPAERSPCRRPNSHRFSGGQILIDRRVLPRHPEQLADAVRLLRDVDAEQ
jgi:hypothetical protein